MRKCEHGKLAEMFREAAKHIDKNMHKKKEKKKRKLDENMFVFYRLFHPRDIERKEIQEAFKEHIAPPGESKINNKFKKLLGIDRIIVAYSRPKNLRDLLCPTTLYQTKNKNVTYYINERNIRHSE